MDALRLIVREMNGARHIAALLNDRLCEYYVEEQSGESLVGAIFLGRVERVLPGVSAAFVKLGLEHNGFLPIHETDCFHQRQGKAPLMTGDDVLVQVKKDAKGDKGAYLTRDITLVGQYAILMPLSGFVGVSKRVTDESERKAAVALGKRLSAGRFGLIVRHAALFASESDIQCELQTLQARWQAIEAAAPCRRAPSLMERDAGMVATLIRDYAARYQCSVDAASPRPQDIPQSVEWNQLPDMELEALWRGKRVDAESKLALSRRVALPGGASLVIDEREALQTIDLNSGGNVTPTGDGELPLEQNLAAVPEIARQIRLRNLSGILLVDFIDMKTDDERERVLAAMRESVRDDRVKTVVHGFTSLGLLEMTRRRTRESLLEALSVPCTRCGATGRVAPDGASR